MTNPDAWIELCQVWDAANPEAAEYDVSDLAFSRYEGDIYALAITDPTEVTRLLDRAWQDIQRP